MDTIVIWTWRNGDESGTGHSVFAKDENAVEFLADILGENRAAGA